MRIWRKNNFQHRILYSAKLSIKCEGRNKNIFGHAMSQKLTSHETFLRKVLKNVPVTKWGKLRKSKTWTVRYRGETEGK